MVYLRRTDKIREVTEAENDHLHTIGLATSCNVHGDSAEKSGLGVCPSLNNTLEKIRVADGLILQISSQLLMDRGVFLSQDDPATGI